MPEQIQCPSGLAGVVRGMKVKDEDALIAGGVAAGVKAMSKLIESCWVETTDKGIYSKYGNAFTDDGGLDPAGLLQGDRMFLILAIRRLSYGDEFNFKATCGSILCGKRFNWRLKLSDLITQDLSEESQKYLLKGNKFPVNLPASGKKGWFRLFTGAEEEKLAEAGESGSRNLASASHRARLIEIEGVKKPDLPAFITEMEAVDSRAIREAVEAADCGVETTLEVICPACKTEQPVELPLGANFLGRGGPKKPGSSKNSS